MACEIDPGMKREVGFATSITVRHRNDEEIAKLAVSDRKTRRVL